jgi:hypothetical protein
LFDRKRYSTPSSVQMIKALAALAFAKSMISAVLPAKSESARTYKIKVG